MATAVLLVFLGALSRLLPHPPNAVALGAVALFSGARLPRHLAGIVPLAALALSDVVIDWGPGRGIVTPVRLAVYGAFAAIVLLGRLAAASARPLRLAGLSICGSVIFFLVSNFGNWLEFDPYPRTAAGLALCYVLAIPWFWNTLVADLAGTAVLFGLDRLARRESERAVRAAAILGLALLAAALPSAAAAQQPAPVSESVVVTATAVPQDQTDLGAATTVITREQIERGGQRTVAEVLRSVPGLDLVQSGDTGALTSVLLRGANSNDTLVLIDGVRMNSPYFAGYDFSSLTTENVERIEIARGPFSALYGSDAMGGVIQIFTRPAAAGLSGRASLEGGNAGQREGEAFATAGSEIWGFAASFRDAQIGGDRPNADWKEKSGSARVEGHWGDTVRAALEAGLVQGEAGTPGAVGAETPHARSPWWEQRIALPVSWKSGADNSVEFLAARVVSRPDFRDPDSDFFAYTRAESVQTRVSDTWTSGVQRLTGFASYERGKVDSGSNFGVDLDGETTSIWGVGIEDTAKLPRGLTATAGLRYDRHSEFGSAWSPRATLSWLSSDSLWKVRASAGTGFRAPTVGELFFPFVGNPNLKAEHSTSYELGAERYLGKGRVEVSLFWSAFRDLIVYDFGLGKDFNVGRARTRGVEVAWRGDVTPALSAEAGYTYLDTEDRDTGLALIRRPRHRAFVGASWRESGLTVSPRATYVGRRPDNDALTGARGEDPSYVRLDLFVRYDLAPLSPFVRLQNLADRRYGEVNGYPAPRRRFAAGLEARF